MVILSITRCVILFITMAIITTLISYGIEQYLHFEYENIFRITL